MIYRSMSIAIILYVILLSFVMWNWTPPHARSYDIVNNPNNQNDTYLKVEKTVDGMWPVISSSRG